MINFQYHTNRAHRQRNPLGKHGRRRGVLATAILALAVLSIHFLVARSISRDVTDKDDTAKPNVNVANVDDESANAWKHVGGAAVDTTDESLASRLLLGLLKGSEPTRGKPISAEAFRSRVETFRKYLEASEAVRRRWNAHFGAARDRGIVVAAGRAGAILNAYVVLHTLRQGAGCKLPVVLAYYGESEFKETTRAFFATTFDDVQFLDLEQVAYPDHHVPLDSGDNRRELGYKLKIYSIFVAPFKELIFLDADSVPLQNPEALFDTKTYAEHGNIFWNDFWDEPVPLWELLHLGTADPWRATTNYPLEAESGQVVLDRVRYWRVLEWVLFLNTHDSLTYMYSMGDKDTFRVAFALAGDSASYNASPLAPALPLVDLGEDGEERTDPRVRYRCLGMLQVHPENGEPFFHHRTADAKLQVHRDPGEYLSPITHITPPVTSDQASVMNWGSPGQSIHRATGRVSWGLRSDSVQLAEDCQAILSASPEVSDLSEGPSAQRHRWPIRLDLANERCAGRDASADPEPILVLPVPADSYIRRASTVEIEAYKLLPFQEAD